VLFVLIAVALIFDFIVGFNSSASIVATVISSRALRPRTALLMVAVVSTIAPFFFGVAVANTIGKDLVSPEAVSLQVVAAGVITAAIWCLATSRLGIPTSTSHALVGGIIGAVLPMGNLSIIQVGGVFKVILALLISPVLGLVSSYLLMQVNYRLFENATPRINLSFKRLQIITSIFLALSNGSNDSQKTMGIITLGLVTAGVQESFQVPLWVTAVSAAGIGLGTAIGGWSLIRTIGGKFYKVRPIHAFTSQLASALVIMTSGLLGGPVSTTHVINSAVMGAGAADRINKVRWGIVQTMLITWIITIPATIIFGALVSLLFLQIP